MTYTAKQFREMEEKATLHNAIKQRIEKLNEQKKWLEDDIDRLSGEQDKDEYSLRRYDKNCKNLADLNKDMDDLQARFAALKDDYENYHRAFAMKSRAIAARDDALGRDFCDLQAELDNEENTCDLLTRAVSYGRDAMVHCNNLWHSVGEDNELSKLGALMGKFPDGASRDLFLDELNANMFELRHILDNCMSILSLLHIDSEIPLMLDILKYLMALFSQKDMTNLHAVDELNNHKYDFEQLNLLMGHTVDLLEGHKKSAEYRWNKAIVRVQTIVYYTQL